MEKNLLGILMVLLLTSASGCDNSSRDSLARNALDLEITKAEVHEGQQQTAEFPYNQYLAKVTIRNNGANIVAENVYLNAGNDQENKKLVNTEDNRLKLLQGEEFQVEYQILKKEKGTKVYVLQVDSGEDRYTKENGGNIKEYNEENNLYRIQIF